MRIGIIAPNYYQGSAGGVETYFRNLLLGLQKIDKDNRYFLFVPHQSRQTVFKMISAPNFAVIPLKVNPHPILRALRKASIYRRTNEQLLANKINSYQLDVAHFPFQELYPSGIAAAKIVTFHDLQHEHYPEFFSEEELRSRRRAYRHAAESADKIISISHFTQQDIARIYGEKISDRVTVVYLCFDPRLFLNSKGDLPDELKTIGPYFYYPAATWPHKNHLRLLEAFQTLLANHPEYSLVFSGISKQNQEIVTRRIKALKISAKVHFLGYLNYEELPAIYKHAYALVFPSLFEGFGIPLLEAMASGCPVLAADNSSIPEIVGKAAILFDASDPASIKKCMEKAINTPKLISRLRTAGLKRVDHFSIEKMAKETLMIYRNAGGQK